MALFAHLSDIHFYHLNISPFQFFNKSFLANFNSLLTRRGFFDSNLAYELLPFLKNKGVTHLIITGDYTSSSSRTEFHLMQKYIETLIKEGFHIYTLPGNHDAYTKNAHKNRSFYSTLKNLVNFQGDTRHNLIDDHVVAFKLDSPWWLVLVDCSCYTPWHKSTGRFSPKVEESLSSLLKEIPAESVVTLVCHYPFEKFRYPKAHLERGDYLEKIILNDKRVMLYLHGHRHVHRIEKKGDLTILDSGSISLKKSSSFNLLNFSQKNCEITSYKRSNSTWELSNVKETITTLV